MVDFVKKRKDLVFEEKIKKKGLWDFGELYAYCYDWFKEFGYILLENKYIERVEDRGKELVISWTASRRVNDYFKFAISIDWHILGMTDTEIEQNGKKVKTNKGEVKMTIKAELKRDYEGRWHKKSLFGPMRNLYEGYMLRTTIEEYEDDLSEEVVRFVDSLKSFLELF